MVDNEKVEETMLEFEDRLEKTISVLEEDYSVIRAGRANPHVLDRVEGRGIRRHEQAHRAGQRLGAGRPLPANQRPGTNPC